MARPFIDKKKLPIYLWTFSLFLCIFLLHDIITTPETFVWRLVDNIWRAVYVFFLHYIFFEYTLAFLKPNWKRILVGIFLIWAHLMLYSFGLAAWRSLGIALHIYTPFPEDLSREKNLQTQASFSFGSLVFLALVRHTYLYIKLKRTTQQLQIEKQEAELNFLRSQTNPHFLFNTLNNIYSLSRDRSDLAPESIMRLSKILRFMLYETRGNYISIEQELKIIHDYIELEKLRYDESLKISFSENIENPKQAIPPLLMIPLVENAFKHGVSETRGFPFVDIHISVKNQQLLFEVKNSVEEFKEGEIQEKIGLSNLSRQLELLYKEYNLAVVQRDKVFTATLKINLSSHV